MALVLVVAVVGGTMAYASTRPDEQPVEVSAQAQDRAELPRPGPTLTWWIPTSPPSSSPTPTAGPTVTPTRSPTPTASSTTLPTPTSSPRPTRTPTPTKNPSPPVSPTQDPDPTDDPGNGDFPTMGSTGPTISVSDMKVSGSVESSKNGQVIEAVNVTSRIKITHDDVTVRNSRINHTATKSGQYALFIATKDDGSCPENVVIENIEIVGDTSVLIDKAKSVYGRCPFTLRDSRIYDVGNGVQLTSGARVEGNFILNNHFVPDSGSHRAGVALNGGTNNVIVGNTIACEGTGCSGGLVMYGDFGPVQNILIQGNLINTTGSYCTYGGSLPSKEYPKGTYIRYIGNHFGREYFPECGRYGVRSGWNGDYEGNEWRNNVWHDTGEVIP
jgi:hypothetical protein